MKDKLKENDQIITIKAQKEKKLTHMRTCVKLGEVYRKLHLENVGRNSYTQK